MREFKVVWFKEEMKETGQSPTKAISSPERIPDVITRPSAFRLCLHAVACLVSLILGFRFSREALLVVVAFRQNPANSTAQRLSSIVSPASSFVQKLSSNVNGVSNTETGLKISELTPKQDDFVLDKPQEDPRQIAPPAKSSRVHVGRHEILIRPWPHPNPVEVLAAHALLERVQQEQRRMYSAREWRHLIVVTPTFSRTFQWPYLTALMHTLRSVPDPLTWIVVEAGRITNQTASLLVQSGLKYVHLNVDKRMPAAWSQRRSMESLLRIEALRVIRKQKLDGVVVFADDSNTHSLRFFDEAQNVKWLGALSVGILANSLVVKEASEFYSSTERGERLISVQGPACNESCHVIGWHLVPTLERRTGKGPLSTKDSEWAGFVLNSRILWEDMSGKPDFVLDWNEWISSSKEIPSNPLGIIKDKVFVEPLGNCGREVLLWWLRVEARADSKFPSRWIINPPLEVVVPSKLNPWLDFNLKNLSVVPGAEILSQPDMHRRKHSGRISRPKQILSGTTVNGSRVVH